MTLAHRTSIQKGETSEYKELEAQAEKMASEIERSDTYRKNLDLENGDGDEEMLYSAVHRDNNQNQRYHRNKSTRKRLLYSR